MKLCLDGSYLLYRARFTAEKQSEFDHWDLSSIFMSIVLRLITRYKPTQVYVLFDEGRCVRRTSLHPEYKANRDEGKDESIPGHKAFLESREFLLP